MRFNALSPIGCKRTDTLYKPKNGYMNCRQNYQLNIKLLMNIEIQADNLLTIIQTFDSIQIL